MEVLKFLCVICVLPAASWSLQFDPERLISVDPPEIVAKNTYLIFV